MPVERKERPILFNGPMVHAILAGRKTVTRRIVKPQPDATFLDFGELQHDKHQGYGFHNGVRYWSSIAGKPGDRLWVRETWAEITIAQAADQQWFVYRQSDNRTDFGGPWRPSIFMPRRACRILLEITAIRVERLHAITNDQCIAEGCPGGHGSIPGYIYNATPQEHFRHVWESTGGDYHANPWVWVIEFSRVEV